MTTAREDILDGLRRALGRGPLDAAGAAALDRRLGRRDANPVPGRAQIDHAAQVDLFVAEAGKVSATISRVAATAAVPAAVAAYLAGHNLPSTLKMAPDPVLRRIPWSDDTTLSVREGVAEGDDAVGVTAAFAGVAETGTLVVLSGAERPTTLNFLPDTHIVVLRAADINGAYEDAWRRLRAAGAMPRTVNWITGPSRTADIEQTLLLGAHGPRRLHIVLIDGQDA